GGLPLDRALEMLALSEEKLELKNLIMELVEAIKGGKSFSEALSDYQYVFGRFYIQMIRVGEAAGTLPTTLNLIVHYLEMQQQLKEQIISASICAVKETLIISGKLVVSKSLTKRPNSVGRKCPFSFST
ncbi:MAG TPA: hypothetical protein ENI40_02820, partial [Candidatus Desulfofervidus auxilii]|nr:hypothetical protein [Candidatus Desulfofervidus auxilii]